VGECGLPPAGALRHEHDLADARPDGVYSDDEVRFRGVVELDLADDLARHPDGLLVLPGGPDGADDSAQDHCGAEAWGTGRQYSAAQSRTSTPARTLRPAAGST